MTGLALLDNLLWLSIDNLILCVPVVPFFPAWHPLFTPLQLMQVVPSSLIFVALIDTTQLVPIIGLAMSSWEIRAADKAKKSRPAQLASSGSGIWLYCGVYCGVYTMHVSPYFFTAKSDLRIYYIAEHKGQRDGYISGEIRTGKKLGKKTREKNWASLSADYWHVMDIIFSMFGYTLFVASTGEKWRLPTPMLIDGSISERWWCMTGAYGGGGPVRGPCRWQETSQAAGDYLGREASQAQQWQDASSQDRKRQQKFGLPPHQSSLISSFFSSLFLLLLVFVVFFFCSKRLKW